MKARKIGDLIDAVEWDGSQKAYEKIVEMCPREHEITMKDGMLTVFDRLYKIEYEADFGDYIVVEHGGMSVLPRQIFDSRYEVVEEEVE